MTSLLIASLVWSLSFGLIASRLKGYDASTLAAVRLLLAALLFAPWLKRVAAAVRRRYIALGALQFGLMYQLYLAAYGSLPGHVVALLTVTTPVFVVLLQQILARRLRLRDWAAAALAVLGAVWIKWMTLPGDAAWRGILLLQGANLCFAAGQVIYSRWRRDSAGRGRLVVADAGSLAWMYVGAFVLAAAGALVRGRIDVTSYSSAAVWSLLYLGVVPTGVAFWLWNRGVARVSDGLAAVMNNLKVPLAVAVAGIVFGEAVELWRLLPGAALIAGAAVMVSCDRG